MIMKMLPLPKWVKNHGYTEGIMYIYININVCCLVII